jgi:hypothetical protein
MPAGEIFDLYAVPSDSGDAVNLTNSQVSRPALGGHDGGTLAILATRRRRGEVLPCSTGDRRVRNLTNEQAKDREWGGAVWALTARRSMPSRERQFTDSDVYRIDVATGGTRI